MPKRIVPLSEVQVRTAKPKDKEYKLFDGRGLFLLVTPSGGKLWRMKYSFDGKEKSLSLGAYPTLSLAETRERCEEARKLLAQGINPGEAKKIARTAVVQAGFNSFETVAREWHGKFSFQWKESYAEYKMHRLEKNVFPWIGSDPINEISALKLLSVLRRLEERALVDTAHRVRYDCSKIFAYAIATGRVERNPANDLIGALPPVNNSHYASLTDPKEVAPLLRVIDGYQGSYVVKCALQLAPMLFVRPGELRSMEWSEVDFTEQQWNIPKEKMKMKMPHIVPLPTQAVQILKDLQPLTGHSRYVFPGHRSPLRCMSDNALNAALRRMGYERDNIVAHGFRAMARTILDEVLKFRVDYIEHQLAHAVKDPLGRAYNRTTHLEERRQMMQQWADYLDGLKQT